jgi:hypothetical protein
LSQKAFDFVVIVLAYMKEVEMKLASDVDIDG